MSLPPIHRELHQGVPLQQTGQHNCLMISSSVEALHPKIRRTQHLPSVFPYSSCANVINSNDAAAITMPNHEVVMLTTHLMELSALEDASALARAERDSGQTLMALQFLRGILPTAEHLRLHNLEVAAKELKMMCIEDEFSELDRQCWKRMVSERYLMHEEESSKRAIQVRAMWKAEEDERERKERLQKLVDEASRKYRAWIKERGKLCDSDPLDKAVDTVEWVCHCCKSINTVLVYGCESCGEKRRFDVEPEVYKQKIRFDKEGKLLPSILNAVMHKINSYALDSNVDGVLSQMLELSGTDPNALASGCAALGQILVNAGEGTDAELREFQEKFLPKAIDCIIFASRSCPEDAYVQRSAMNGLWWRFIGGRRWGGNCFRTRV